MSNIQPGGLGAFPAPVVLRPSGSRVVFPSSSRVIVSGNLWWPYGYPYNYGYSYPWWYYQNQQQYPSSPCPVDLRLTPDLVAALTNGSTVNVQAVNQCGQIAQVSIGPPPAALAGLPPSPRPAGWLAQRGPAVGIGGAAQPLCFAQVCSVCPAP